MEPAGQTLVAYAANEGQIAAGGRQEPFVYGSLSSQEVHLTGRLQPTAVFGQQDKPAGGNPVSELLTTEHLAAERVFWESLKDSTKLANIQAYLDHYPGGAYEVLARNRLQTLRRPDPPAGPKATRESVEAAFESIGSSPHSVGLGCGGN